MARRTGERRKHPRTKRGFRPAKGQIDDGLIHHVDNISASGVLCHTRRPVPEMTKMSIELELPSPVNRRIDAEGIVVRCVADAATDNETFRVAIFYTKITEEHQQAIRDYVDHELVQHADG